MIQSQRLYRTLPAPLPSEGWLSTCLASFLPQSGRGSGQPVHVEGERAGHLLNSSMLRKGRASVKRFLVISKIEKGNEACTRCNGVSVNVSGVV